MAEQTGAALDRELRLALSPDSYREIKAILRKAEGDPVAERALERALSEIVAGPVAPPMVSPPPAAPEPVMSPAEVAYTARIVAECEARAVCPNCMAALASVLTRMTSEGVIAAPPRAYVEPAL